MSKKEVKISIENEGLSPKLKGALGNCCCYVLITCSTPSQEGKMDVQMHYEGEESLAAFLVENAVQVFDEKIAKRESQ